MKSNKPRIFISHAWEDKPQVRELESKLKAAGAEVWVDHSEMRGGQNLLQRISDALRWCNTLLLIWSKSANTSEWVKDEWTSAFTKRKLIIPCKLDETDLPDLLISKLSLDFRDRKQGLAELLHALGLKAAHEPKIDHPQPGIIAGILKEMQRITPESRNAKLPQTEPILRLRSTPNSNLSEKEVAAMLKKYDFFCKEDDWNKEWSYPNGKGITHQFELQQNGQVVFDAATGLWWQQSGSEGSIKYVEAEKFVRKLCNDKFAGFDDWRLPTLEEAMSLMEKEKMNGDLYIDPVFDKAQRWVWTSDGTPAGDVWIVNFLDGDCRSLLVHYHGSYVRAVRP